MNLNIQAFVLFLTLTVGAALLQGPIAVEANDSTTTHVNETSERGDTIAPNDSCVQSITTDLVQKLKPISSVAIAPDEPSDVDNSAVLRYLNDMTAKIAASPALTRRSYDGKDKQVVISFRVHARGELSDVRLERTSSPTNKIPDPYDLSAKGAVEQAAPFSAFPSDISTRWLDATATISYPSRESLVEEQHAKVRAYNICKDLAHIGLSIYTMKDNAADLEKLEAFADQLQKYKQELGEEFEVSRLQGNLTDKTTEIKKQIARISKLNKFDTDCENKLHKEHFPSHLRDEPVNSSHPDTSTLGRAFCTAINGGGTVEFLVMNERSPTVGIAVITRKRRFVVILQKKMTGDLTEEWRAVEVQTPSDRKAIPFLLGNSFMASFPEMVQDE